MFGKKVLRCPRCKETTIAIQMVELGSVTKKTSTGLIGNTYNAARGVMGFVTFGLAKKIMPKATGKEKTKNKLVKMAFCQSCGYSWELN